MTIDTSLSTPPRSLPEIGDYLAKVEQERRRQLETLSDPQLDPVAIAYRAALERIVEEVGVARQRHTAGLYGICARCDKAINPERLEFRPWVIMCTECSKTAA
jgi:RNA polymerase-binding transcription factor DksA